MATATASVPCVRRGEVYPLEEFAKLVKLGKHGLRTARRQGLRVLRPSGEFGPAFVSGDDWLTYLDERARSQVQG